MKPWNWLLIFSTLQVRALQLITPPTATVGQTVTVTWVVDQSDSLTQFGIGIPFGGDEDINRDEIQTVDISSQQQHGIIMYPVTSRSAGLVHFEAYSLTGSSQTPIFGSTPVRIVEDPVDTSSSTQSTIVASDTPIASQTASSTVSDRVIGSKPPSTIMSSPSPERGSPGVLPLQVILAIVFGTLIVVVATFFGLFWLIKKRRNKAPGMIEVENAGFPSFFTQRPSSEWEHSSLGPSDSISQVLVPLTRRRKSLLHSTNLTDCSEETEGSGSPSDTGLSLSRSEHF
ncbi:hypothetical protein K435DRAFT_963664 [Dendrothele bispora CBS 962.96]|uniref:Uncharacterized protein n=1 Tax=Dendrothele bispora (strain CBS 962.96) TaxID=1314807 RepID=A0A4S8MES1_DENBC|nr:hypothetical protein K435DRAFT_963664 [Dendrothele bispora CBS 962.96]